MREKNSIFDLLKGPFPLSLEKLARTFHTKVETGLYLVNIRIEYKNIRNDSGERVWDRRVQKSVVFDTNTSEKNIPCDFCLAKKNGGA